MLKFVKFWLKAINGSLNTEDYLTKSHLSQLEVDSLVKTLTQTVKSPWDFKVFIFKQGFWLYFIGIIFSAIAAYAEIGLPLVFKGFVSDLSKNLVTMEHFFWTLVHIMCLWIMRVISGPLGLIFFCIVKHKKAFILYQLSIRRVLSMNPKRNSDTGQLINTISLDIDSILRFYEYSHDLFISPLKFISIAYILISNLKMGGVFGILGICASVYGGYIIETKIDRALSVISRINDERTNFFHEFISNVKTIKASRLEQYLENRTHTFSQEKCKKLVQETALNTYLEIVTRMTPQVLATIVLLYAFYSEGEVSLALVFTTLSGFSTSIGVFLNFTIAHYEYTCHNVSINRIFEIFLSEKSHQQDITYEIYENSQPGEVIMHNASFAYSNDSFKLENINFHAKQREFHIITGKIGSGKSSFSSALLAEMKKCSGEISVDKSISYVPQEPFLVSASIKENILLGEKMDEHRYKKALLNACLVKDIESLAFGDETIILPGAINISGGQRHRISLARALYQQKNILLVDDVLTSIDVKTGKEIFYNLIAQSNHQTVIINMQIIPKKLPKKAIVHEFVNGKLLPKTIHESSIEEEIKGKDPEEIDKISIKSIKNSQRQNIQASGKRNIWKLLKDYVWTNTPPFDVIFWLSLFIGAQYVTIEIEKTFSKFKSSDLNESSGKLYYFQFRVGLVILYCIILTFRNKVNCNFFFNLSSKLCKKFLPACFRAPYTFFSDKQKREVENLFAKDLNELEKGTHVHVKDFIHQIFRFFGGFASICVQIPMFILPFICFSIGVIKGIIGSSKSTTNAMEIEAVAKAKSLSNFEQAVKGSTLLRTYNKTEYQSNLYFSRVIKHSQIAFNKDLCEIICVQVGYISNGLAAILVLVLSTISLKLNLLDVQTLSEALIYSYQFSSSLSSISKRLIGAQRSLNCVSNIQNKLQIIPLEDYEKGESLPESNEWPQQGNFNIKGLTLKYATQEYPVVNKIEFSIKHGEKISIVGRTGSGKSSLLSGLIRLIEPISSQKEEASLLVSGKDIRDIKLSDLRSRIGFVSQEVVTFEGSLRNNIDPYNKYSDEVVSDIIKHTIGILKPDITKDFHILERGNNLSMGERQMISFARVLIKNPKIILADEATSNIDDETEIIFNKNLHEVFKNCTILAIIHKPESLVYFEKCMIFGDGKIVKEVETKELLENLDKFIQYIL